MNDFSYVLFSMRGYEMVATMIWSGWMLNVDDPERFFVHY